MISLTTFTIVHTLISLVGIGSGCFVLAGLLADKRLEGWTTIFLATTIATSVTGFGFPFTELLPSHIVGILSLIVLAVAVLARYSFRLAGAWRWIYVVSVVIAFYFNVFVLIVQLFRRVPVLKALAPTQSEPVFIVAQVAALLLFVALGARATSRFHPSPAFR